MRDFTKVCAFKGRDITYYDLPVGMFTTDIDGQPNRETQDFREAVESFERHYIIGILNKTNWNRLEAARRLKVHRNTLLLKMKALKIKKPRNLGK